MMRRPGQDARHASRGRRAQRPSDRPMWRSGRSALAAGTLLASLLAGAVAWGVGSTSGVATPARRSTTGAVGVLAAGVLDAPAAPGVRAAAGLRPPSDAPASTALRLLLGGVRSVEVLPDGLRPLGPLAAGPPVLLVRRPPGVAAVEALGVQGDRLGTTAVDALRAGVRRSSTTTSGGVGDAGPPWAVGMPSEPDASFDSISLASTGNVAGPAPAAPDPAAPAAPDPAAPAATDPVAPAATVPVAPVAVPQGASAWRCPITGGYRFSDTWGEARSSGRNHRGTDVYADYGTPLVAVVGGEAVNYGWSYAGGYDLFLLGDDGERYYYAHLAGSPVTGRVEQGQVIGYVGDSGNATGVPHLHFEIHPGGAGWTNPYPTLLRYC